MSDLSQLNDEFDHLDLRFEQFYLLAATLVNYSFPDGLRDLFDSADFGDFALELDLPHEAEDGDWDAEMITEWLVANSKLGFLAQVATPVREYTSDDSYDSSWGYYQTAWLYAETVDDLVGKAKAWAVAQDKRFLERFHAKAVAGELP